jgi:hypothetical protein
MQTERPAGRSYQAPGPRMRARRDRARAEAIERLARWKRGIVTGAVVAFGAFIGLVGIAGARGASSPSSNPTSGSPPVTSHADQPGGDRAVTPNDESDDGPGDDRQVAPNVAPDDGFFGRQGGGYGFGGGGSQSPPLGQSGAS